MSSELAPIDIRHADFPALIEEVRVTRKPRRIIRDNEEVAVLMPTPAKRQRLARRRPAGPSITEQTAGAFKAYRLPRPLTREEEKAAFEQGVADEVMESLRD